MTRPGIGPTRPGIGPRTGPSRPGIGPTRLGMPMEETGPSTKAMVKKQLQLHRAGMMLLLGVETGPGIVPRIGTGKMTMKAAKMKLGQKTGLRRFGTNTGTNGSEGMTHPPSMASGMPILDRVDALKGWSGTSFASALV